MKEMVSISICATLFFAQGVFAGAGHDHGPKHGGVIREVSSVTYELVAKADSLTLHVSGHGKPIATAGAKAQITLYASNEKTTVALESAGDNLMAANV
jgi:hypothetical protein